MNALRCVQGVAACLLVLVLSISSQATWPSARVVVLQSEGHLTFEFFEDSEGPRQPLRIYYLSIQWAGGGPVLWRIQTAGRAMTTRVVYGTMPQGFLQVIPQDGTVPALKVGERYRVLVMGDGNGWAYFTYEGLPKRE